MKVIKLRISLMKGNVAGICGSNLFQYISEAIEEDNGYYYRIGDVKTEITKYEYEHIIINPYLYYFSTALKLHFKLRKRKILIKK